jgi:hypothetical protein
VIVEVLAANAAFAVVAVGLGEAILRGGERLAGVSPRPPSLQRLGAALLVGFGGCASIGVLLAAARIFGVTALAVCGAAVVVLTRHHLVAYASALRRRPFDPVVFVCLAGCGMLAVFNWLAALAPPEATDELAYHLPEARSLEHGHVLMLGHDQIYGNLPALLESLYAEALAVRGTALAHALHFSVLIAFLLVAAGVVRRLWGGRAAALAALGILLYSSLLYNATTAYVDAGATAYEAGAVLLAAAWLVQRKDGDAVAAALLVGLSLSVKYTTLLTAALLAVALVRRNRRFSFALAGLALAGCAFWYGKNLVRFGNPVYPFLFGHPQISDDTYRYFVNTVHAWGPRTIGGFVETPTRFASDSDGTAFLGFALAPLALVARGSRRAAALLVGYVVVATSAWYWLESAQTRFLFTATVIAIVLGAVALVRAPGHRGLALAAVWTAAALAGAQVHTNGFNLHVRAALQAWLDTPKSGYALGLESRHAYLERYFGCQVDAVELLEARRLLGNVALWDLSPPPDFPRHNQLEPIKVTATTTAGVRSQLRARDLRFALTEQMPVVRLSSNPAALPILRAARPFWTNGVCTLYRLRL